MDSQPAIGAREAVMLLLAVAVVSTALFGTDEKSRRAFSLLGWLDKHF
ncbi:hypothetical protein [Kitasatospora griseola]|nr:hypothetical protein [Kitasatospora griseola]GGR08373.1 hypothetical protein GCM10010195_73900 [Kitasatospora griseola]